METNLLPCPKCNGPASLIEGSYDYGGGDRWYAFSAEVECLECGLLFKVHNDYPKKYVSYDVMWDFAVEAWNTRAERTCRVIGSYYDDLIEEDYTDLSCGHHVRGAEWEFSFCPDCGAKVVQDA